MLALKLTKIGNSVGTVLPDDALRRLNVGEGDTLYLVETADGYRLTRDNPEFEEAARRIMKKRRNALRELAK